MAPEPKETPMPTEAVLPPPETPQVVVTEGQTETLEQLILRAKLLMKRGIDIQVKAGLALRDLKNRITDRDNTEGQEWDWSWPIFVEAKLDRSYAYVQRLIGWASSDDPVKAIEEHREQVNRLNRERRGSFAQTTPAKGTRGGDKPEAQQLATLMDAWNAATSKVRAKFMKEIGLVMPTTEALTKLKSEFVPAKRKAA
jgi:hypothetical protein